MPNGRIDETDAKVLRDILLPAYAAALVINHTPSDIDGGPSCDERGCMICNGGMECVPDMVRALNGDYDRDPETGYTPMPYIAVPSTEELVNEISDLLSNVEGADIFG